MAIERHNQEFMVDPESFVHPRQEYLWQLLKSDNLPEGADILVKEAIEEYQVAFGKAKDTGHSGTIKVHMAASLAVDGPNTILAGKDHLMTVQFGEPVESVLDTFASLTVVVFLRNMDRVNIYPDFLRYPGIDPNGNSIPVKFLLQVPDHLRGNNSGVDVLAFNGGRLAAKVATDISLK